MDTGRLIIAAVAILTVAAGAQSKDRHSAWKEDLTVASDTLQNKDRSYSAEARRAARDEIERTRSRIDQLTDQQIVGSLARAAALSDNAHTRVYLLRNRSYWRRYPIRIWRFADGWYVIAARAAAAPLAGGKITHVQGMPIEQAFERVRPLYAGNAQWATYMGTYTLTSPDALLSVGVLDTDVAEVVVQIDGTRRSVRLQPDPLDARTSPEESWWFLSPQHLAASGWTHALAARKLPQVLLSPELNYSYARCERDVLYVRYSRAADAPGQETVRTFGERVLATMAAQPPGKLVLDLRFNTGGDLQRARPFMEALAESQLARKPGGIAVLIGPSTFSAGITPAAWLRARSKAVLVGTQPGDRPVYWSEGGNVTLPNSGVVVHYADGLHHYSDTPLPKDAQAYLHFEIGVRDLEPDVPVDWTWEDYLSGSDPVAAAAIGAPLRCADEAP
ncbi:MAG TPA: hypothetical protein VJQ52_22800 [Steroidobacteraceae bacterium]|nr:hypothetical protein [Steroidobacteraceae bacterium]